MKQRIIVGVSGASGAIIGRRVLELASVAANVESHLVITPAAERTICLEQGNEALQSARALATVCHPCDDVSAAIASGSFDCQGMIIAPCSMRTLSAIAYGLADNLLTRAADVTLKERRRLVLIAREAPLHSGHLEAMLKVTNLGGIIFPPVPAFYTRPQTIDDIVTQIAARSLSFLGVDVEVSLKRWSQTPI
ncbi:MAG: UbiX family flavin prenyltransferase [Hyphomicrobiaceae bacterium]|nr:UbiX family flavin prenyltransferase [Hyphomicrobiaceae bacterium]